MSEVIEAFFVTVKEALAEGDPIYVRGFGSFVLRKRTQKIGRNEAKNEAFMINAHLIPFFKPANEFMEKVKQRES